MFSISVSDFLAIVLLLGDGQKITAIKKVRGIVTLPNFGLRNSKELCDALADAMRDVDLTFDKLAAAHDCFMSHVYRLHDEDVANINNTAIEAIRQATSYFGENEADPMLASVENILASRNEAIDKLQRNSF